jgi:hypothetical protein
VAGPQYTLCLYLRLATLYSGTTSKARLFLSPRAAASAIARDHTQCLRARGLTVDQRLAGVVLAGASAPKSQCILTGEFALRDRS